MGRRSKPVVADAERTKRGTDNYMAVNNRGAPSRDDRLEVGLTVLISFFFDKSAEVNEAVFQLGLQSLERTCQLFVTTIVDMCTSLRFT